jgi:hypothetical protein
VLRAKKAETQSKIVKDERARKRVPVTLLLADAI